MLGVVVAGPAEAVPSFARQTGMTCQACHTVFPELTPFGRRFKLGGYSIDNLPQVQGITPSRSPDLELNLSPPIAMMLQASLTRTGRPLPDSTVPGAWAQNDQVLLPEQASLFYAGRVAPHLGAFVQMTYDSGAGSFGWDNTDVRYVRQVHGFDGLTYGVTLNNNPTVQDVWNATPAWTAPFSQQSSVAPAPGAATQLDGGLADRGVVGVSGYAWFHDRFYGEAGVYRSAPQGYAVNDAAGPIDSTAGGAVVGGALYWRVAAEHQWGRQSIEAGAYGLGVRISGADQPVGPPANRFRDTALDAQYQFIGDTNIASVQATLIHEHQTLDSSYLLGASEHPDGTLSTVRVGGSYYYRRRYGASLGFFSTVGSRDAALYPPGLSSGFAGGSPDSSGWIGELDYVPWLNVKLLMQYVAYHRFNGGTANYDGMGTNAGDNDTLYLLSWFAF